MDILPQILINGLIAGALYGLIALGLSLIYGVLRFMNFAHGEMAMLGAYFYFAFFILLDWPIVPSILGAIALCGVAGFLFDKLVFTPLRNESPWTLLITSIGVSLFIKSTVLLFATGRSRSFAHPEHDIQVYELFGGKAVITNIQIMIILSTLAILVGLALFLKTSKTGKAIRAVSDNMQAASIIGINVKHTITLIFLISTCIAGFAGILVGYEQNLTPNMGLVISIFAFSAVVVGGLGSIWGAVIGGFALGFIQNLAVGIDWFGVSIPTSYKSAIAFIVLILMLLIRPRGLLGIKLEEEQGQK